MLSHDICLVDQDFEVIPAALPDFIIEGPEVLPFGELAENLVSSDIEVSYDSIIWSFQNQELQSLNPEIPLNISSPVCARVYYNNDCFEEICLIVRVQGAKVYFPNVMSSRSDSPNRHLIIFTNDQGALARSLRVFARWGNVVFEQLNKEASSPELLWDGVYIGKALQTGDYVYELDLILSNGEKKIILGDITILK